MFEFLWKKKKAPDLLPGALERLETLERGFKRLALEWEDAHAGLLRLAGRVTGALKRAQNPEPTQEEPQVPEAPTVGQHQILQEMRRRRGLLHG